jgi:hypothetical protein
VRRLRLLLSALLLLALVALPVGAADEPVEDEAVEEGGASPCAPILDDEGEPTGQHLCTSQHWFTANDAKVGNVEGLSQTEGESTLGFPSWDDTEPASVTTGSGGGYHGNPLIDIAYEQDPASGVTFDGELAGNVDALAFDLYLFKPAAGVLTDDHGFRAKIDLGGRPIVLHGEPVSVPLEAGGDAVLRIRFVVEDLLSVRTNTLDDDQVRPMRINVTPYYVAHEAIYVYDAAEAPSSMIVNPTPEQLEGFTVVGRS